MPDTEKVNILLVDDRPENLVALEALLGDLGQNLIKAGSGKEALKHLLQEEFAVILLDVQMPEMDGFETAGLIRARERSSHTPIVFLTAINKDEEHVARGYSVGAVDYLFKPIVPEILKSKVAAFVDLARKSRELQDAISERQRAQEVARKLNEELELRVSERTAALAAANQELETEIAERRKLEAALQQRAEELAESHRAKDQFLAMLGHELRNPLAPIRNAVTAIRLRGTDDPLLQRAQDVIDRQVQHLSRLVDDLLDIARITRGKIELRKDVVDLVAICEHAVETSRSALNARHHTLHVELPAQPIWLLGDFLRLEQVITNLLTNAAKYTDPEGRVWLTLECHPAAACGEGQGSGVGGQGSGIGGQGSGVRGQGSDTSNDADGLSPLRPLTPDPRPLTPDPRPPTPDPRPPTPDPCRDDAEVAMLRVRDTGRGIPREMLLRIFDVFTQAAPTLDRAQGGLGLGLTLVKNLVQMHGGSVAVQSEGSGRGSEFAVFLPILSDAEREAAAEGQGSRVKGQGSMAVKGSSTLDPRPLTLDPSTSPHSRRVLVVDDNLDAAATLAELLALWGHDVRVAHTGATAIETAHAYQPDMVLLDIGLPGMDGYEVARRLRECEDMHGILLVAITGYGQEEDRRRSQEATLDFHLTKPVDPEALQEVLAVH